MFIVFVEVLDFNQTGKMEVVTSYSCFLTDNENEAIGCAKEIEDETPMNIFVLKNNSRVINLLEKQGEIIYENKF